MKKIISLLVVLAMLMSMAPAVFAAEVTQEQGDVVELVLGNNELDAGHNWTPELTVGEFVATETGTLYITFRAFYSGTEPTFNEYLLDSTRWVQLKINGEFVTAPQQTVEVAAGDVVTVSLESVDGDAYHAWINLSFDGFYEEPLGSVLNPVVLKPNDCPTDTVTIPAGEEVWYHLDYQESGNAFSDDYILYVYGENAYILINDYRGNVTRIDAVDGVVSYAVEMYDIRIGNAGTEAAAFELDCEVPLGTYANPHQITEGEHVVNMVAGNYGYYFEGYVPADGTLTVTVEAPADSNWTLYLGNEGDPDSYSDDAYLNLGSGQTNTATMDVKEGDFISGSFRLMDSNYDSCDGTAIFTFDYSGVTEEPPVEPPVDDAEELVLGSNAVEVGAEGKTYTWTAEEDGLFSLAMTSKNWTYTINGVTRSSADQEPVYMTVLAVTAGDVITLTIGTADGAAAEVRFSANVYAGTAANPVALEMVWNASQTAASLNADLPAGEYVYSLPIFGAGSLELTINGVVTAFDADPMGWDPATVVINNEGETNAVFSIKIAPPAGTMYNPDPLQMGYNEAELIYADYQMMRCYAFTAEEDTLLALTMMGDNWYFWGMMQDAAGNTTAWIDGHAVDENPAVTMQVIKVAAGETFLLILGTIDGSETVTFNAMTYAGTEADPVALELVWNASQTAASLNVDLPTGEYVYSLPIFGGGSLELTINGVVTAFNADPMGWDPATVVINNEGETNAVYSIKIAPPAGTMYNPDPLQMGETVAEMIYADYQMMRCYAFTAEEDTLLALTMMGDNWYFWGMIQDATGNTTAWIDGHDATVEPVVSMQIVKVAAGETFVLILGTVDGSETVTFNAMTYAGTEEDPIMVEFNWDEDWTSATLNIDMPAGEYVFATRGLAGTILTANGEEIPYYAGATLRDPDMFMLNNEGETNAVFELAVSYPPAEPGTMDNPEVVEEGEYTVEIGENNFEGYFLSWTAEEDGVLTITVSAETFWYLMAYNVNSDDEFIDHWSDEAPDVNTFTINVKAGDEVIIAVNNYDFENGMAIAGEVTVGLDFTPAGAEVDPNAPQLVVESVEALPGDEVMLMVSLVNNPGFTNGKITVNYDETGLEFVGFNFDETPRDFFTQENPATATMNFIASADFAEDTVFFAIVLKVKDNAAEGAYNVSLTVNLLKNDAEENVEFTIVPGTVTLHSCEGGEPVRENVVEATCTTDGSYDEVVYCVGCGEELSRNTVVVEATGHEMGEWYVYRASTAKVNGEMRCDCAHCDYYESKTLALLGDVNGDGKVNTTDAKLIMQYDLGLIGEDDLDLTVADVNGDGKVNTTDAKLIMQFDLGLLEDLGVN